MIRRNKNIVIDIILFIYLFIGIAECTQAFFITSSAYSNNHAYDKNNTKHQENHQIVWVQPKHIKSSIKIVLECPSIKTVHTICNLFATTIKHINHDICLIDYLLVYQNHLRAPPTI